MFGICRWLPIPVRKKNVLDEQHGRVRVGRMKRLSFTHFVLLLALGVSGMNGCLASTTKEELDLTTYDPSQDHRKIAAYYSREATKLRQTSEEMSVRIAVYERLFGPESDWVSGTRLLAQSYQDAAREHELKAREHLDLIAESRRPSAARSGLH